MKAARRGDRRPPDLPPPEEDPIAEAFGVRRTLPAFLFSTAFHAALLVLLATVSLAVVKRDERVNVRILDAPPSLTDEEEGGPTVSYGDLRPTLRQRSFGPRVTAPVAGPSGGPAVAAPRVAAVPSLPGPGRPTILGASPGTLDIPLHIGGGGLAGGSGIGAGGGGFGDVIMKASKGGLELALVIDTTGSMQSVIDEVKAEVKSFIASLQRMVPATRVAVVAYRDRGEEYVTKWSDFSFKTAKVQSFVDGLRADGGGDYEEAVKQGIQAAVDELSWSKHSKRVLILIGGSPPHKADVAELLRLVREFRDQHDGSVGAIDVTKRLHAEYERADWVAHGSVGEHKPSPMPGFYRETTEAYASLAGQGGGELLRLGEEQALLSHVMVLTFGTRWRAEVARLARQ